VPAVLLAVSGKIDGWQVGQLSILISGLVYYMAGVHFDRRYLLPGAAMMLSSAILCLTFPFVWTACGLLMAGSLIGSFLFMKPHANDGN
jgi:hypothetical protein